MSNLFLLLFLCQLFTIFAENEAIGFRKSKGRHVVAPHSLLPISHNQAKLKSKHGETPKAPKTTTPKEPKKEEDDKFASIEFDNTPLEGSEEVDDDNTQDTTTTTTKATTKRKERKIKRVKPSQVKLNKKPQQRTQTEKTTVKSTTTKKTTTSKKTTTTKRTVKTTVEKVPKTKAPRFLDSVQYSIDKVREILEKDDGEEKILDEEDTDDEELQFDIDGMNLHRSWIG